MTKKKAEASSRKQKLRLVVFDVEGVLVPKRRYLLFEASRQLSILNFLKMLWAGLLYEAGLTSLGNALKKVYRQLRGLSKDDLFKLYQKMPLIQGAKETIEQLKTTGCKIALISSGLPQFFVEDLGSKLKCDYAFGLDLEVVNGRLTGNIGGDVIKPKGKALILNRIQKDEALTAQDCAVVADDRNNLPLLDLCSKRIGYNPDFLLSYRSDAVVKGDLKDIVPILAGNSAGRHSVSKRDLLRETIHISGFLVPALTLYWSLDNNLVLIIIFIITMLYTASELARMLGINFPLVATITWRAAIQPEIHEFVTAPILFAAGIMLTLFLFFPPNSYAAIAVFTLGDGTATLIGKTIGKHVLPYNKGKKIEGTLFGFLFASLGAAAFISPLKAVVGATAGMVVESLPSPLNDNITIPLFTAVTLALMP